MCGIIAVIGSYRYSEIPKALIERGRDSQGIYEDEFVQLIQTRLEITPCKIDLPFQTDRYVLLFNGEIYNWQEFGGLNEFESIIKGFEKYGNDFESQLDGQFFILIYDKLTQNIVTFNDEFKINSCWYIRLDESLILASNLRSLPKIKFKEMSLNGYGNITNAKIL